LESSSDLAVEFADIVNSIHVLEKSKDDVADMMDALLSGKLSATMLSVELLSSVTNQEVSVARVTGLCKQSSCYLRIKVPKIETWNLYWYQNITFKGNGSKEVFYRLPGHNSLLASNKIGYILRYDDSVCNTDRGTVVCDGDLVEIVSKPVTCVELLLALDVDEPRSNLPTFMNCWIKNGIRNQNLNLRNADDYYIPYPRVDSFKNIPLYSFALEWNNLAEEIKYQYNRITFKIALKEHLFNSLINNPD
jgi:hypothetical protein